MIDPTPVLPFPAQPAAPTEPSRGRHVEVTPAVGYRAVTLTYYDAEYVPRISVTLDETVPDVAWWRRMIQKIGDGLPTRPPARPSIFGPRLLP